MRMKRMGTVCSAAAAMLLLIGCESSVEPTQNPVRLENEVPKVELGEGAIDMNPATDNDIDIDTPVPGDS